MQIVASCPVGECPYVAPSTVALRAHAARDHAGIALNEGDIPQLSFKLKDGTLIVEDSRHAIEKSLKTEPKVR